MQQDLAQTIQRRWLHSHEEDTPGEMVFRPDTFAFPRSRGRAGFELKDTNELIEIDIAPSDGSKASGGRWAVNAAGELAFYRGDASKPSRVMKIVSASPERLVVSRE
jgi:hypothetical protein